MTARVGAWWRSRGLPERRLLRTLGALVATAAVVLVAGAVVRDVWALEARVARAERRLVTARKLAGRLEASEAGAPVGAPVPLVSLVETTVSGVVGTDRLTRLDPGEDPDRSTEARLAGVDLADVVRVLGALEDPAHGLLVRDLELSRHPDEAARYDAVLVVTRGGSS